MTPDTATSTSNRSTGRVAPVEYCCEAVVRQGRDEPCDREAVTYRLDPEDEREYPVCRRHAGPSALSVLFQMYPTLASMRQAGALIASAEVMVA